jgi:vacuolar-type H+-ATPase subunit C/Vma6
MLRKTRYHWLIAFGLDDLAAVKNRLERQYYSELWDSLSSIPSGLEGTIPHLLRLEAELQNLVWSLRLKRYYSMGAADIEPLLIAFDGVDVRTPALRAVGLRFDSRQDWQGWKWERLIPDSRREDGGPWFFDVRGFEVAANDYLQRRLRRRLHLEGETYVPLYAYFRIKESETIAIQGIIEGIMLAAWNAGVGA